jgi:Response regulator containing CheY-like receiver domain and AraC-type DNA-binding domain
MRLTALIVDDEDAHRIGLAEHIGWEKLGYGPPLLASDASEAYELAKAQAVHVLLADVNLNGYSGIDIVRTMKAENPGLCALMVSGHDDFEYLKDSMEAGASGYILKPIDPVEVESWLERFMRQHELRATIEERDERIMREAGESLRQARRHFLSALVNEAWISEEELRGNCEALAMPGFETPWRLVGVSAAYRRNGGGAVYKAAGGAGSRIASAYETSLALDGEVISLPIGPREALLLLAPSRPAVAAAAAAIPASPNAPSYADEALKERLEASAIGLERNFSTHAIYSLPIASWDDVKASYKSIMHCLRSLGATQDSFILCCTEAGEGPELDLARLEVQSEQLLSAVRYGSAASVGESLAAIKARIAEDDDIPFATKQAYCLHLLSSVLQMSGEGRDDSGGDDLRAMSELLACPDSGSLHESLAQAIQVAATSFQAQHRKRANQAVETAMSLMRSHYGEELSLADLAEAVHLNPSYLSVLFKSQTGTTVSEYLQSVRIEKAKELLASTNMKIYEISVAVGFKTIAYFTSLFKKMTGATPGEFRKG